jgi:hypothetical protein
VRYLAGRTLLFAACMVVAVPIAAQTAQVEATVGTGADVPMDPEPQPDPVQAEAAERFDRGVAYYAQGDFGAALAEFLRAYELTSHWAVLYNLGQVSQALHRNADATRYFEEYLAGGGAQIGAERRTEVEQKLGELRSVLAVLRVTVDADGSEILVDDEIVGSSPLADAIYVDPGPHVVVARHPGYGSVRREVTLASEEEEAVALVLITPTGPIGPTTPPEEEEYSIASQWWFWTILGAVVAGGAVTAGVLLAPSDTSWTDGSAGTLQLD